MNAPSSTIGTLVRELDFDDLDSWADERILNRGKGYVKRVDQLSVVGGNILAAWVTGTARYTTSVRIGDGGALDDFCTCPYLSGSCKHAVALVLAAVERVKIGQPIPVLDVESDLGQSWLAHAGVRAWISDEQGDLDGSLPSAGRNKAHSKLEKVLAGKDRDELLRLLVELSARFPEVRQHILESEQLASGQVDELVGALRSEIRSLAAEPAWYDHWGDDGNLPDYSRLEEKLRALADRGHADALVRLGEDLWIEGNAQVEQADDEGETAVAIASCLDVVVAALPQSSLSPPEQLLWLIDRSLEDEYSLLDVADETYERPAYTPAHWRQLAATLETRLSALAKPRGTSFSDYYRRGRLLDILLYAYARAEWEDRIIPRLEDEADACRCYPRLVDELLAAGDIERARQWCVHGYSRTAVDAAGIASSLQERLRDLAQKERRHDLVAAYRAQDFFDAPSSNSYSELRKAAQKAKCWPAVSAAALDYLETGRRPSASGQNSDASDWPLPSPEVESPRETARYRHARFPNLERLIDIAILENRADDVVELYQRLCETRRLHAETDKAVANAVADTHPNLALSIWAGIVNGLIGQVKPRAYEEAAVYLRLMKKIYASNHRLEDWHRLLEELGRKHKAKRRLMAILDTLSNKKLVG